MNIHELSTYNLADAVKFHRRLNPRIWGRDEHLLPEVREKLLAIAADFQEFLGVEDLNVRDITISGSNAAYSYTKNSDIDLHLVVEMPDNPVYQELFNAKKYQYNSEHNIKIGGADVELYVQPADQAHHSQGIYSIRDNKWISIPQRKRAQVDDACVRDKVASLDARIHSAVQSKNLEAISRLWDKIKAMRKIGLEQHGEFGCENIAFKMLRNSGCIKLLKDTKTALEDRELSLREAEPQQRFRYGFSEGMQSQPYSTSDGVAASTKQFLEDSTDNNIVQDFIQQVTTELGIDPVPEIHLHTDPDWSEHNQSFGRYDPDAHTLNVSMPNRHVMDVLRTVAHELVHCSQNQQHGQLPDDAGETGSRWENDANARAGIIMRDWANSHPEHFDLPALEESASGYIPKNKREAAIPQYAMALSVDIKPGQVGKEANKLGLKTGRNGEPGLLMPEAENLLREFAEFSEEQDNLFEITMSPSSLKKLSAQTGALAGMEFEMIVPGAGDNDDGDQEPDYDFDQRCRSIQDARDFFYDGDFNSRRDVENMSDRMQNDYAEWLYERIDRDFVNESEYLISEWVANNVDESEWNPNELEGEARQEALDEFISNVDADPSSDYYQQALDEYREENQDSYDESDWLDAEDLDLMSGVENAYSISWPHWRSTGGGEVSINDVANSFQTAVGRDVKASSSYHSGRVERPSTKSLHYIVEPDGSLDPDNSDDQGLEFVSPPLPIEELLSDLNKVKAWADKTGCYTNASTGLHINVSVPGWTGGTDQLDYVKLAVLLGDEFVLSSFGRTGNTYAKSAMGKIRGAVRQNPDRAKELMDKMKSGMDQLASKIIHSRSTEKYTSINVKNGYIEFRSPGGDWLNDNFAEIDNTLRRFTVALSAAVNPEQYRQEYLKKLYKVLDVSGEKDPLSYFAKYAAGELPRAALKSFVRQAQAERKVKSGKADAEEYDKLAAIHRELGLEPPQRPAAASTTAQDYIVSYELDDGQTDRERVRARNADAAMAQVRDNLEKEGYEVVGIGAELAQNTGAPVTPAASTTASHPEGRGRPHDPTGRYAIVARSDSAAYGRTGGPAPNYQFRFNMQLTVANRLQGRDVLQAWAARNNVNAADYMVVDTTQYADAAQGGVIDVAPAPQPAGGEFTGNWLIRAEDGTVLQAFGGIGNSQADANRTAQAWAQRNPDVMRQHPGGVDVVPEMMESLRETKGDRRKFADGYLVFSDHLYDRLRDRSISQNSVEQLLRKLEVRRSIDLIRMPYIEFVVKTPDLALAIAKTRDQNDNTAFVVSTVHENLRSGQDQDVVYLEDMPQPSHGPGAIKDLNEPLGPEFPPTMPAGTVKVDVSDVYDWYKLGQHISNMKDLGQHDFGQGPPSAILSFGDEDLEHQYIQALKQTGLTTTDIDPVDPDQPPGMPRQKTDPTYNVDESQDSNTIDADQVLQYVKKTHAPEEFNIEYSITDHAAWELKNISLSELNLDPDGEQQDPYNRTNWVDYDVVRDLMPKIEQVLKANPIVVDSEGWIIDGNHRAMAAMEAGLTSVPALVPVQQDMLEGQDDNEISFQIQKSKNKFATTMTVNNEQVGVYQYDADTGRSIAEIYPEFKGKGLGKLLVLHAIYTAAQLGLNFQEDESRTAEYDNILDSLSSSGYIVDDEGYWYVTGEGEQFLKQSLKQDVAEARTNPDKNIKRWAGKLDLAAFAENIKDKENWGVSMTVEPKLGINPRVGISEDTPKGIYFYPLEYFIHMVSRYTSLPWGDNMPYMQLFQYDRSGEMTRQTQVDPAQLKQALSQYCPEEIIQQVIDEPDSLYDGTPYWIIYDCLSRLGKSDETNIIRWNKVLRDLGFTSVFDPGRGWIATGEPTQGIILDPRIIKQHKTFVNRNPTILHRKYDINRLADAINWSDYYNNESQRQQVPYGHPDRQKTMLAVANDMLRPFLGKTSEEAKEMGLDQALKAASDKVIEILKQGAVQENFADGKNPGRKEIDPDVYEDLSNSIIARTARQIVPTIRAKSTPEGYVYLSTQDGLSLVIGCNIAGGSIDINIGSQPMETTSSGPHKGAVTKIIEAVYQAAAKKYGAPIQQGTLSIDHDAGHGVWQHIAQKLGLQHDAHMVKENFADGKNPGRKGLAKRSGVNTKASVSSLRKTAKNSSGEKQRMAHWLANMKAGRAKAKRK